MRLRNSADYRSLVWVATAIALVVAQYCNPALVLYLCPISCYLAISIGTITHNHNHRPTFRSRRWNDAFSNVLTFFYGYPALMWVPTHNLNHHHFVNRPGDATATWRFTNKHNFWVAITYPFVSGFYQSYPIREYLDRVKQRKPSLHRRIRFEYVFWIASYALMLALAGYLHHGQQFGLGLYVWFFSVILPAILSTSVIMIFNYIQHVHTDAWSEQDHSRNFTGWWFNFLFFNNGYHTAHHNDPGLHWSELPGAHAQIDEQIDSSLNERNLLWFFLRQYLLAPLIPSLGTRQIGSEPSQGGQNQADATGEHSSPKSEQTQAGTPQAA